MSDVEKTQAEDQPVVVTSAPEEEETGRNPDFDPNRDPDLDPDLDPQRDPNVDPDLGRKEGPKPDNELPEE